MKKKISVLRKMMDREIFFRCMKRLKERQTNAEELSDYEAKKKK